MKFIKILFVSVIIYTLFGIPLLYASSLEPAINRVAIPQGQKMYGNVNYTNSENFDIEILLEPYTYNPKTDEIFQESKGIFLKVDTDTFKVKANSTFSIRYEIVPRSNIAEGTYYNILAITPIIPGRDVDINNSISQLIVLDVVNANDQVKGIATTQYEAKIEVVSKGIPFIKPLKLKYSIRNNSNFLLIPQGRIDVFNEKNFYQPIYEYINKEEEKLYPGETLEKEFQVSYWHISDLYVKRIASGQIFNGLDNSPKNVEIEINNYLLELGIAFIVIVLSIFLTKSLIEDRKKRKS